jgi:16S rRNA A1518/A1519 N6-dimethyltransferase RsmA/KsgA/DIM1 with predicted DNA glycosylase/AP lyase activity
MRVCEKSAPLLEVGVVGLAGLGLEALERTTKVVPREVEHRAVPTMKASKAAGRDSVSDGLTGG